MVRCMIRKSVNNCNLGGETMKKRILAVAMMLVLALGMVACGKDGKELKSEGELIYTLPEGFTYDEASACYYAPGYPEELANINYLSQKNDGSFDTLTKANIEDALEQSLSQGFGTDIDIDIVKWEETEVQGYEAVLYACEYEYMGVEIGQQQICINGKDNFHYLTFTDYADSDYADDFEECIKGLKFSGVN